MESAQAAGSDGYLNGLKESVKVRAEIARDKYDEAVK